ncbi:MAG: hypothetical protein FJ167_05790 [Gammaproteobacteria bacterium]|nr:hypothetical protein [Gammaproteobacteria bacterium]
MPVYILPHGSPSSHFASLASVSLAGCDVRPSGPAPPRVGDLSHDDHLVAYMSSRIATARMGGVRCRVSVLLREPPIVQGRFYRVMPLLARRFHRILTHNRALLDRVPSARFVPHGGRWVKRTPDGASEKLGRVSMIASGRKSAPGHRLRHRIATWARSHAPDLALLGHGYQPLVDKADGHSPYLFSVVIENSREPGYFTEKIVDSLLCSSIPIYWGAPDIASYFDPRGMIPCPDESALRAAVAAVGRSDFDRMAEVLAANRRRADLYADFRSIAATVLESDRSFEPPPP